MKATIDIPDELYRKVKAKSALEGRPVRAVTIELFERWLEETQPATEAGSEPLTRRQRLEAWLASARAAMRDAPPGPTAREILEEGRSRLETVARGQPGEEMTALASDSRVEALDRVFRRADELMKDAPPGPTAREILVEERNRFKRADKKHREAETPAATSSARVEALEAWLAMGREASRHAPPGPTATEILAADRNRLETREDG